jgi:3-isopropylmalate dehydratase small subunit
VISTSFADIFQQNSLKNSLLPIIVPADVHAELFAAGPDAEVKIDGTRAVLRKGGKRVCWFLPGGGPHIFLREWHSGNEEPLKTL